MMNNSQARLRIPQTSEGNAIALGAPGTQRQAQIEL
jgi:hypothetical protein